MNNLLELERKIRGLGWYKGTVKMTISQECEFEGFYGLASEGWEQQITIDIIGQGVIPDLKVKGSRFDTIDDVAKKVLEQLDKH